MTTNRTHFQLHTQILLVHKMPQRSLFQSLVFVVLVLHHIIVVVVVALTDYFILLVTTSNQLFSNHHHCCCQLAIPVPESSHLHLPLSHPFPLPLLLPSRHSLLQLLPVCLQTPCIDHLPQMAAVRQDPPHHHV